MASPSNVGALHRNLLAALGTGIASGKYPAGQVLTLDGVSAEHGVSRSVAREAIRVLESMGMVASRRRVGHHDPAIREMERLRPAGDPLATRIRRPRSAFGVAVRVAARLRTHRRGVGRPPSRSASVPDHGGGGVGYGDSRAVRRPRVVPVGGQGLSPHAAGSQRQRDVSCAQRRGGRDPDRPDPSPHDACEPEPGGHRVARRGRPCDPAPR